MTQYAPAQPGDGPRFLGAKANPRVDKLAPLFLQVRDTHGRAVKHTKGEWLELATEFSRHKAFVHAEMCTRKAGKNERNTNAC